MNHANRKRTRGFMLLEVILAIGVFAIAITAFISAMRQMGRSANLVQRELRVARILESAMQQAISRPVLEEGKTEASLPDGNTQILTETKRMESLQDQEGNAVPDLYLIRVSAQWFENGTPHLETIETWRNTRMYLPQ